MTHLALFKQNFCLEGRFLVTLGTKENKVNALKNTLVPDILKKIFFQVSYKNQKSALSEKKKKKLHWALLHFKLSILKVFNGEKENHSKKQICTVLPNETAFLSHKKVMPEGHSLARKMAQLRNAHSTADINRF